MRKKYIFGKKFYLSIIASILVMLTMVATTFAWVGVFANSTFEQFDFNIFSSKLEEYGIEISSTGEKGSFSDTIDSKTIKKQILLNWGITQEQIDNYGIDNLFSSLNMEQCTTVPNVSEGKIISLNDFTDLEGNKTKALFKFDIYVSAIHNYDASSSTEYMLDVFLDEGLIQGTNKRRRLINPFTYSDSFVNPLIDYPDSIIPIQGSTMITSATVNSKSVCRVAFEKYEVVEKGHPEQYLETSTPKSTIIYSGDSYNYPTINNETNTYEFGGILEDDINLAVGYYNSTEWRYSTHRIKTVSLEDSSAMVYGGEVYSIRGVNGSNPDLLFNSTTNHLIDSTNPDEQIGIDQMMKVTVSFWIEGWDADCWAITGNAPSTLSISMSISNEKTF